MVVAIFLIVIGAPFALLGFVSLFEPLPDMSRLESFQFGLKSLGVAAIAWGASLTLSWWATRYDIPSRFSLKALMIGMTLLAVALGLLSMLQME